MSACDDFRSQLPLFVGGDLEAPLAERLEEHLGRFGARAGSAESGGCAECARVLEALSAARAELVDLPKLSPAPAVDLWEPIRAALVAEGRIAAAPRRTAPLGRPAARRLPPALWRVTSAAAALALLAFGAHLLQRSPTIRTETPRIEPGLGGEGIAEQVVPSGDALALPGGLRRLAPGEELLSSDPSLREFRDWPGWQFGPGMHGQAVDPSHPTLKDRLR